jgi:hypothetical protein
VSRSKAPLRAVSGAPETGAGAVHVGTDGTRYVTTKFHWFDGDLVLCPACDGSPCEPDCPEQMFPAEPRR